MTWEEKLAAMQALAATEIAMRKPGDWYCHMHAEIGGNGMLCGVISSKATPQDAVEDVWREVSELPTGRYLVMNAHGSNRRAVRWNGYMWADVEEEVRA